MLTQRQKEIIEEITAEFTKMNSETPNANKYIAYIEQKVGERHAMRSEINDRNKALYNAYIQKLNDVHAEVKAIMEHFKYECGKIEVYQNNNGDVINPNEPLNKAYIRLIFTGHYGAFYNTFERETIYIDITTKFKDGMETYGNDLAMTFRFDNLKAQPIESLPQQVSDYIYKLLKKNI